MKKIKQILLIDDDQTNNFFNHSSVAGLDITKEIIVLVNGQQGYNYLPTLELEDKPLPELIILDHFMPVMDETDDSVE